MPCLPGLLTPKAVNFAAGEAFLLPRGSFALQRAMHSTVDWPHQASQDCHGELCTTATQGIAGHP